MFYFNYYVLVNITTIHLHYRLVMILGSNVHFKIGDVHYPVFTVKSTSYASLRSRTIKIQKYGTTSSNGRFLHKEIKNQQSDGTKGLESRYYKDGEDSITSLESNNT